MTRLALKVDVDTYRGTCEGVPAMLADLGRVRVRASFFFSVGPDRSGRAVLRVFRKPGFLGKMLRTNAVRMYGFKTMLYGTLLPAPRIGRECEAVLRAVRDAGHEVALHAWDHVAWQDGLDRFSPERIREELEAGLGEFERIFGERPRAFAAPAWFCTDDAFEALDSLGLDYTSVSRAGAGPFYPEVRGRRLKTIDVPTTLPTLDEMLGVAGTTPENYVERLMSRYRPDATEVLTVHAETEGLACRELFRELLGRHVVRGVEAVTVGQVAEARRASSAPARRVTLGEVPGRAGQVVVPA